MDIKTLDKNINAEIDRYVVTIIRNEVWRDWSPLKARALLVTDNH